MKHRRKVNIDDQVPLVHREAGNRRYVLNPCDMRESRVHQEEEGADVTRVVDQNVDLPELVIYCVYQCDYVLGLRPARGSM